MDRRKNNPQLFKKGQSGNPGGQPLWVKQIRQLAESHTTEAFLRIVELSKFGENATIKEKQLALAANQYIVDRALGRPAQAVNLGDQDGGPLQISVTIKQKDAPTGH